MRNYLAFDLGASSGRAILATLQDGRLSLRELHRFDTNAALHGKELLWDYDRFCVELETALGKAAAVTRDIAGIAVDTWGVDYVLFDAEGKARRAPFCYRDGRTNGVPEVLFQKISQSEIYGRTGIQFMAFNTLYQLAAHAAQAPEELNSSRFLMMPDALEYHLGGDFTTEYTDASTGNLLDPAARDWDFELIDRVGLPRSIFPKIVPPCTMGGTLKKEYQEAFGLGPVPILKIGSHDTASAVAAVPAPAEGDWAYISCGTWALLGAEIDGPCISPETEAAPFTNEGGIGGKIRFLTNIMGCWLLQESRRDFAKRGMNRSFSEMADMAKAVPAFRHWIDPNDGAFLAPGGMPARIAEFSRQASGSRPENDGELLRCIYDSLSLCFADKLSLLERILKKRFSALNVVGGGTQDSLLMQLTADAIGIPVIAGPVEATAIGNALAQAIALGDVPGLREARECVRNSFEVKVYSPDSARRADCQAALARFRTLFHKI